MAFNKYKKNSQTNQENVFRLRDEFAIPRVVTDLHIKIQPYLNKALIAAYNVDEEVENENRANIAYYFGSLVTTTMALPSIKGGWEKKYAEIKDQWATKNPSMKNLREFALRISRYAKDHIKTSELFSMYLAYAEVLSEAGLLEAYDRRESLEELWENGF